MVAVRKYPTRLAVRCPQCAHQGMVVAFLDRPLKLKCSRCGNRNPIVVTRDRTRAWASRRRAR